MPLRTRKPTGAPSWPLILLEGAEKSGKSWAAAEFTASERIGRSLWLDLGEGIADEYAAIPGADYDVIMHDGTWHDILGQVTEAHAEARQALAAGEKPVLLVIDSMTALWALLKDWVHQRARSSRWAQRKLADDPNFEIRPSTNLWNDANDRHEQLMRLLMTFPGPVVMTARGKEVAVIDAGGNPIQGEKEYRVEAQKSISYQATAWVRMTRDTPPTIVGLWSVNHRVRPGVDQPQPLPEFSLEWLVFDLLGCGDGTQARPLSTRPELSEVATQAKAANTRDEINAAWALARDADYLDITTDEGLTVRDILLTAVERVRATEQQELTSAR
ncbi:AAA family ATPase [Nocardia sp. CDC159]|uniref:AAA family ATPase n=1 Tax=Nocardia pulmonis TaxID=2951408 RepID=A0A9X2J155_9NOCA|nr:MULTISPECIES: AAA family ATPase [Nocardia]MCM6777745.1 AAA family ATPase [Nocardia pulmonis]MCM6790630.1 AAA family ATPase [Nocardia sp. CDC159]